MNKSLNFFVIFAVVCGACLFSLTLAEDIEDNETNYYSGVKVYKVERWCAMVGGICVEKHECAEGQLASKSGLCPHNKHLGVECCYEVPIRPATCRQHLGACMPDCSSKSLQRPATDCSNGDICCVLV